MEKILYSFVIPVYNKCNYLERCIKSILAQTYDNFEILCIDDGSTDGSLELLEKIKSLDSRIKVYTQPNAGAGAARTRGIKQADGMYILFVDADDWIESDCLQTINDTLSDNGKLDIILFSYSNIYDNKKYNIKRIHKFLKKKNNLCNLNDNPEILYLTSSSCDKAYKKEFLTKNNIYFTDKNLNFEDMYFWLNILLTNVNIYIIDKSFYNYDKYVSQSSSKNYIKNIDDTISIYKNISEHPLFLSASQKVKNAIFSIFSLHIINCWAEIKNKDDYKKANYSIKQFICKKRIPFNILNRGYYFLKYRYLYRITKCVILFIIKKGFLK